MRALTLNEVSYVSGGFDQTEHPLDPDFGIPGMGTSFGNDPANPSSSGGNGSGNNGISPSTAQNLIGVVTITGAIADPITGLEAAHTADAANTVQNYNQSTAQQICEGPDQGTWDSHANNGGGGCKY